MYLILNQFHDPAFNLALEEYFLTQTDLDLIMLWRNSRSVIIGSNQNAIEEIDVDYVRDHAIPVVRRQSGGGAVFHDLGNINFTVIHKYRGLDFGDYETFTAPVREYMETLGIHAEFSGRNDLVIEGKKFSGNAQAVKNGRIMSHGCILFNTNISDLSLSLRPRIGKKTSKGVKTERSRVTNVADHLSLPMTAEEFYNGLAKHFGNSIDSEDYELRKEDIEAAQKLADEKYNRWEWNFGCLSGYNCQNSEQYDFGFVDVRVNVKHGSIDEITLFGDFFGVLDKSDLEKALCGVRYERLCVESALSGIEISQYIYGMTNGQFVNLL